MEKYSGLVKMINDLKVKGKTRSEIKKVIDEKWSHVPKGTGARLLRNAGLGVDVKGKVRFAAKLKKEGYDQKRAISKVVEKFKISRDRAYRVVRSIYKEDDDEDLGEATIIRKTVMTNCNMPGCNEVFETEVDKYNVRVERRCPKCRQNLRNNGYKDHKTNKYNYHN